MFQFMQEQPFRSQSQCLAKITGMVQRRCSYRQAQLNHTCNFR